MWQPDAKTAKVTQKAQKKPIFDQTQWVSKHPLGFLLCNLNYSLGPFADRAFLPIEHLNPLPFTRCH
jgi:hypothetical protein